MIVEKIGGAHMSAGAHGAATVAIRRTKTVPRTRAREHRPRAVRTGSTATVLSHGPPGRPGDDEPPLPRPLEDADERLTAGERRRLLYPLIDERVRARFGDLDKYEREYDRVWRRCRRCGLYHERVDFGRASSYCRRCESARVTSSRRPKVAA